MKVLALRKRRFWEKSRIEKKFFEDIEIEIVYIIKVNKRIRQKIKEFDLVVSLDFKEFFVKSSLMKLLAVQSYEKAALRHGGVDRDILEVQVDVLNEENAKILIQLALKARYVILHSELSAEKFDFLCLEAGVSPEFESGEFRQNLVVHLGEEFLIKHTLAGKIYYDILPEGYFLPEFNMLFSEYLKKNPDKLHNVKIRELMSK